MARLVESGGLVWVADDQDRIVQYMGGDTQRVNALAVGAKGDGVTDDTNALQRALSAMPSGGVLWLPPGVYKTPGLTVPNSGITIAGAGINATRLLRSGNNVMLDASGSATGFGTHQHGFQLRDLTIDGGGAGNTAPAVRMYYADTARIENVIIKNCGGSGLEGVEVWDSRFTNLWFDNCGLALGANTEAFRLVCTKEGVGSGFGLSTDNINNIWATDLLFTSNRQGDVLLSKNGGSAAAHRCYYDRFKFENQNVRNGQYAIKMDTVLYSSFRDFNLHPVSFDAGQSTKIDNIDINAISFNVFDGILLDDQGSAFTRTMFKVRGTCNANSFSRIMQQVPTPSVAGFEWIGANNSNSFGPLFYANHNGAPTKQQYYHGPIEVKAGTPADVDFDYVPLDGAMVGDSSGSKIWVRLGGTWKSVAVA